MEKLWKFLKDEEGTTAVEYGLMVGLVTAALAALVLGLSGAIGNALTAATNAISGS